MTTYGIEVSKEGYDVMDPNIDPKNLAFSSKYTSPKIYKTIRFEATGSQAHGLSYPPAFFSSCRLASGYDLGYGGGTYLPFDGVTPWFCMTNSILQSTVLCSVAVDDTTVYCDDMGISDVVIVHLLKDAIDE